MNELQIRLAPSDQEVCFFFIGYIQRMESILLFALSVFGASRDNLDKSSVTATFKYRYASI